MSTTTEPLVPNNPPLETQTTVGNYFVSNYPPFSFWKKEDLPEIQAAMPRSTKCRSTASSRRTAVAAWYRYITVNCGAHVSQCTGILCMCTL